MGRLGAAAAGICVAASILALAAPARADEPLFGFTYTTDLRVVQFS